MQVQNYLFFEGRCEEALNFYKTTLGAQIEMLMRFEENPEPPPPGCMPDDTEKKVMHSAFRIGESVVFASDGRCGGAAQFQGFSLSLGVQTEAEAQTYFTALCEGGTVMMPLGKTFWSPAFGMVTDRFGVLWMVIVRA